MNYPSYPVSLLLAGRRCLVVGDNEAARAKVLDLRRAGATVVLVAPQAPDYLRELGAELHERAYLPGEAAGYQLVVVASEDPAVRAQVFSDGEAAGVFVNTADDLAHCSFIMPAVARRGPVSVAVSSDGAAPSLSSYLRDELAAELPEYLEVVLAALVRTRAAVLAAGRSTLGLSWRELVASLFARASEGPDALAGLTQAFLADALARRTHVPAKGAAEI